MDDLVKRDDLYFEKFTDVPFPGEVSGKVSGKFKKGDHIKVLNKKNSECARGLSSFSSDEILRIMGHHSKEIEKILGYIAKSEVIHKDDMVEV